MCYEEAFQDQGIARQDKNGYEIHKWRLEKWAFGLMGSWTRVKSSIPMSQYAITDASA